MKKSTVNFHFVSVFWKQIDICLVTQLYKLMPPWRPLFLFVPTSNTLQKGVCFKRSQSIWRGRPGWIMLVLKVRMEIVLPGSSTEMPSCPSEDRPMPACWMAIVDERIPCGLYAWACYPDLPRSSTAQGRLFPHSVHKTTTLPPRAEVWSFLLMPDRCLSWLVFLWKQAHLGPLYKGRILHWIQVSSVVICLTLGHGLPSDLRDICNILGLYPLGVNWSPPPSCDIP